MRNSGSNISNDSIFTSKGREIPKFELDVESIQSYFLNRSIILYGASNSGKSTIIKDLLFNLKNYIPSACVICPTNKLNGSYNGLIPKPLIHSEMSQALLDDILKRQHLNVKLFNLSNDINKLESLYSNMLYKEEDEFRKMNTAFSLVEKKLLDNNNDSVSKSKQDLLRLREKHTENVINFYKRVIKKNCNFIDKINVGDNDKILMKNININPNFLIIIDDAAVTANVWCKYDSVKELFFNGRHHKVTFMIAFQDDKLLESGLRKNAFINIFTTEKVCNAFFNRNTNNFNKQEKDISTDAADSVFNSKKSDKEKNYKKLIYIRESSEPYRYYIASLTPNFTFGSKQLQSFCGKVTKNESEFDVNEFEDFF